MTYHISITPQGVKVDFEVGSLQEALGILHDSGSALTTLMSIKVGTLTEEVPGTEGEATTEATTTKGKRGRKPAPEANAPAPMPPPAANTLAPPTPESMQGTGTDGLGIPPGLQRVPPAPGAGAPPPPPPIPPQSAPPTAPAPVFILGGKVADEIKRRGDASPDKGASLLAWLISAAQGHILANATFDEAVSVMRFSDDDKVRGIAQALQVAA